MSSMKKVTKKVVENKPFLSDIKRLRDRARKH